MPISTIRDFFKLEATAGVMLVAAAAFALLVSNSPLSDNYARLLETRLAVTVDGVGLDKPLLLWINDGLMAVFFLLVGLELKREAFQGVLSSARQVVLPVIAAIGGMVVPAAVYVWFNMHDPAALRGWAIPAATDIAFTLGVMALLRNRIPIALKVFVTTLAVVDDLGAVVIIAIFYSGDLSPVSLSLSMLVLFAMFALNRWNVINLAPYILLGVVLWILVLKSGVHASLAGIAIAFAIPLRDKREGPSPLHALERALHPWVAYAILPIFAFANAGVSLSGMALPDLLEPVPLGIGLGLFLGKQVGTFGASLLAIRLAGVPLPRGSSWTMLYGACVLTGIGFTMSLFIGGLAFTSHEDAALTRLGIIIGSLLSAVVGYTILSAATKRSAAAWPGKPEGTAETP